VITLAFARDITLLKTQKQGL